MDARTLTGLIFIGVLVVLGVILVVRAKSLREKEYRSWLDSYHATTAQPETDPARLRELWTTELRARNAPRRTVAFAQNHTLVAATGGGAVQPPPPVVEPRTNTLALFSAVVKDSDMRARVTWFDTDLGGRATGPPVAGEYRPNALFLQPKDQTGGLPEVEFGSVMFRLATDDSADVELVFWSPQDLSRYIYDGSPLLVMEGPRPVGFARMYEDA